MIDLSVRGLEEMINALSPSNAKAAMLRGAAAAGRDGANQTKINWPVDTGLGRADTQSEAREEGGDILIVLGTNKAYAKPVEYGTGVFSDAPDSKRTPYFPPPSALAGWAKRHGLNPYAVAWAIFKKGGTKPQRMFRNTLESRFFQTIVLQRVGTELRRALDKKG